MFSGTIQILPRMVLFNWIILQKKYVLRDMRSAEIYKADSTRKRPQKCLGDCAAILE